MSKNGNLSCFRIIKKKEQNVTSNVTTILSFQNFAKNLYLKFQISKFKSLSHFSFKSFSVSS